MPAAEIAGVPRQLSTPVRDMGEIQGIYRGDIGEIAGVPRQLSTPAPSTQLQGRDAFQPVRSGRPGQG